MNCRYCGRDESPFVIIPEDPAQVDLALSAVACVACATKQDFYCEKHKRAHIGFGKSGNACIHCIEEVRDLLSLYQEKLETLVARLPEVVGIELLDLFYDEGSCEIATSDKARIVQEFLSRNVAIRRISTADFKAVFLDPSGTDKLEQHFLRAVNDSFEKRG